MFLLHPSEHRLSITVCAARMLGCFVFRRAGLAAKVFAFKKRLDIPLAIVEESRRLRVLFNPLLLATSIGIHI